MKACRWYQLEFPGTLSGELRVDQEERVREHVESCPDCRGELDQFRRIDVLLTAGLPEPGRVRQFQQEFLKRLDAEVRLEKGHRRRHLARAVFQPALLPLAAAAGVAGFLVWSTPPDVPGVVPGTPPVAVADAPAGIVDADASGDAAVPKGDAAGLEPMPAVAGVSAQQDAWLDSDPGLFLDYAVVRDLDEAEIPAVLPDGNG